MDPLLNERASFPVAVILEKYLVERAQWSVSEWRLFGVVAGEAVSGECLHCQQVRNEPGAEHYLWRGLNLRLHRDSCESYWLNLISPEPSLYLVCEEGTDAGDLEPVLISADFDEAGAYLSNEGRVLKSVMPGEIYKAIEGFVLQHFEPEQFKKRQRKRWKQSDLPPEDKLGLQGTVLGAFKGD